MLLNLGLEYQHRQGSTQTVGCLATFPHPATHNIQIKKSKTYFMVAVISDILRDLPISQNQLPQSADDRNMEMFKNITK